MAASVSEDELTASVQFEERKYRQACQIVIETQKASGSWLQRQMGGGLQHRGQVDRTDGRRRAGRPPNHVGRRENLPRPRREIRCSFPVMRPCDADHPPPQGGTPTKVQNRNVPKL